MLLFDLSGLILWHYQQCIVATQYLADTGTQAINILKRLRSKVHSK